MFPQVKSIYVPLHKKSSNSSFLLSTCSVSRSVLTLYTWTFLVFITTLWGSTDTKPEAEESKRSLWPRHMSREWRHLHHTQAALLWEPLPLTRSRYLPRSLPQFIQGISRTEYYEIIIVTFWGNLMKQLIGFCAFSSPFQSHFADGTTEAWRESLLSLGTT